MCCNSVIHYRHPGKNMGGLQSCLSEIIRFPVQDLSTICEIFVLLMDISLELDIGTFFLDFFSFK